MHNIHVYTGGARANMLSALKKLAMKKVDLDFILNYFLSFMAGGREDVRM